MLLPYCSDSESKWQGGWEGAAQQDNCACPPQHKHDHKCQSVPYGSSYPQVTFKSATSQCKLANAGAKPVLLSQALKAPQRCKHHKVSGHMHTVLLKPGSRYVIQHTASPMRHHDRCAVLHTASQDKACCLLACRMPRNAQQDVDTCIPTLKIKQDHIANASPHFFLMLFVMTCAVSCFM